MKAPFAFFCAAVLAGCTGTIPHAQPDSPAKYRITIGLPASEQALTQTEVEEVFRLLQAEAGSRQIACQSVEPDPEHQQIVFNVIGLSSFQGSLDPGLDYFVKALSRPTPLGFWDLYRNNDDNLEKIFLDLLTRHVMGDRLKLMSLNAKANPSPTIALAAPKHLALLDSIFRLPETVAAFPSDLVLAWSLYPLTLPEGQVFYQLFALKKSTGGGPFLTGRDIHHVQGSKHESGMISVDVEFKPDAAVRWAEKTRWAAQNSGREIGIVMDGWVITTPQVLEEISDGRCLITGNFDLAGSARIVNKLKLGSLPFELKVVEAKRLED